MIKYLIFSLTLSREFNAQYADDNAEKTDPLNFRLHVPIFNALSSTSTALEYRPCANSSCPITDIITNGEPSSFIAFNWRYVGSNVAAIHYQWFYIFLHIEIIDIINAIKNIYNTTWYYLLKEISLQPRLIRPTVVVT